MADATAQAEETNGAAGSDSRGSSSGKVRETWRTEVAALSGLSAEKTGGLGVAAEVERRGTRVRVRLVMEFGQRVIAERRSILHTSQIGRAHV